MIEWPVEPSNKKYTDWYCKLIHKAQHRNYPKDSYGETHHIIPKSLGGSDDKINLVKLSAREHYIAHALLWKMKFPGIYHAKMVYAFNTFIHGFKTKEHKTYTFSSRMYESFKKDLSLQISIKQTGVKLSPERVEKSASKRRGRKAHDLFSPDALINIAEGRKHRVYKEETRKKRDATIQEIGRRPKSEEHKRKISLSGKGKHNHYGQSNPMFGKKHSEETKEKIRQTKLRKRQEKLDNISK